VSTQQIEGGQVLDGTIATVDLADRAVTSIKLGLSAVESDNIQAGAVLEAAMAVDSVNTNAIKDDAVTEVKILNLAVSTAKLQDNSVITQKLNNLAVTEAKLATASVSSTKIAPSAVTNAALAGNAVAEVNLQTDAVTELKIQDLAVSSDKLQNGAVTDAKLASGELHLKADTTVLENKKLILPLEKTLSSPFQMLGTEDDVTSFFSTEPRTTTAATSTEGVIADDPPPFTLPLKNRVSIRDQNGDIIEDASNREIFGRLSYDTGNWTLHYYVMISGVETAHDQSPALTDIKVQVGRRYNMHIAPEDAFRGADLFTGDVTGIAAHIAQTVDAHDASAISVADTSSFVTADNVEDALLAIVGSNWVEGTTDNLYGHISKVTGAHAGSAVSFSADGGKTSPLLSTQLNAAIEELHGEVEALQTSPPTTVFGYKAFTATAGQTVFDVTGATNAPFNAADVGSIQVFRNGVIQREGSSYHYTLDPGGYIINMASPVPLDANILVYWHKTA
jgi:hypothetical protein